MRHLSADWLLPDSWRPLARVEECYFFNPSVFDLDGQLLMAYRVVLPDMRRRIAICRLDKSFDVRPGSAVALSDHLRNAGHWHADPRFCRFRDRLLLHFNSGAEAPNSIFMVDIDRRTLLPLGPCRPVSVDHPRQAVEKNWMFFEHDGELYTIYSIAPHRVHRVRIDSGGDRIQCTTAFSTAWEPSDYTDAYGIPRGSTPPVRVGNAYFSVFHSQYRKRFARRVFNRLTGGTRIRVHSYGVGLYSFRAEPPFVPELLLPTQLLECPLRPESPRPSLSTSYDACWYPSGSVLRDSDWTLSVGLHDDRCGLVQIDHESVVGSCRAARLS